MFGLICDNNLYIKVTEPGKVLLKEVILRPPYDGAKDYFYISEVDDRDHLVALIKATLPVLPKPKAKKKTTSCVSWLNKALLCANASSFCKSSKKFNNLDM